MRGCIFGLVGVLCDGNVIVWRLVITGNVMESRCRKQMRRGLIWGRDWSDMKLAWSNIGRFWSVGLIAVHIVSRLGH